MYLQRDNGIRLERRCCLTVNAEQASKTIGEIAANGWRRP